MFSCWRILTWKLLKEESYYIHCLLFLCLPASCCVLHGITIMHREHHFPLTYRSLTSARWIHHWYRKIRQLQLTIHYFFFKSMHWGSIYSYTVICFIIGGFKRKEKMQLTFCVSLWKGWNNFNVKYLWIVSVFLNVFAL